MQDMFINRVIANLIEVIPEEYINILKNELQVVISDFDVTKKCTSLVVYDDMPEEVKLFLAIKLTEGMSKGTLDNYKLILTRFFKLSGFKLNTITANDVRVFLYNYQKEYNVTNRTIDHMRSVLSSFFGWCNSEGYIAKNPMTIVKPIKYERKDAGYLTETELEMIRLACKTDKERAIVEFLFSTGCRVSELINAELSNLDLQIGQVKILGKGSKWRIVYLGAKAKLALNNYLSTRKDNLPYIFVTRGETSGTSHKYSKNGVESVIRKLGDKAGITRKVYPHLIRHTTATLGMRHGMPVQDIQKMLGHSSISTTMIYANVIDENVKESHRKALT